MKQLLKFVLSISIIGLKFTPLEFETNIATMQNQALTMLKFTPLEFETIFAPDRHTSYQRLKFTPLEFETKCRRRQYMKGSVKIYSVGV